MDVESPAHLSVAPACPLCGSLALQQFLSREQVPVHQNRVFPSRCEAQAASRGDLDMRVCRHCGFVLNHGFDAGRLEYEQDYDNTQSHSGVFDEYLDLLVEDLVVRQGVRDAQVVEVGCGKGHFLRKIVAFQDSGNQGLGFDPSYRGPLSDLDGRLRFERRFYDAQCARTPADVVVCRHVIEHVADPLALLRQVRAALRERPNARVFFETPCVRWILREQVVWDFFYEHCALFCAESLQLAFERTGFEVLQVRQVFGDQYLWLEARPAHASKVVTAAGGGDDATASDLADLAQTFGACEQRQLQQWSEALSRWNADGPVALWGAGAKGVTFAHLLDPQSRRIECVVDINPAKQGGYVAGSGHAIVAPSALKSRGVATVVLMNPNYRQEVQATLDSLQCTARLIDWSPACE
jgi:SAM-dependent methyltransferase